LFILFNERPRALEVIAMRLTTSSPLRTITKTLGVASAAALALLGAAERAEATGMQGHIFMAECAAEQTANPRLRAIFEAHPLSLVNGAFFPDSGYTAEDHDQGEIAHWEQYVQAYIEVIRERYKAPYDDPEAAAHVAFLMGIAAHGITDSTFDSLLFDRAKQVDPGDPDTFDTAMDVFIVNDMPRYFVPEYAYDAKTHVEVFARIPHPVTEDAISDAMTTARSGISVVSEFLYSSAEEYGAKYPWARSHMFDPRTPGGYPFGAKVVTGYYEQILRRLDGDVSADGIVIGTYPDAAYPMVTLDRTRPDGKIRIFFGHGIDRTSLSDSVVAVTDDKGAIIPTKVEVFRGDKWANVLTVEPADNWQPSTKYKAVLSKAIRTLNNVSPSKDIELSFTTCAPDAATGDCPEVTGAPPPSACPDTIAKHKARTGRGSEEEPPPPAPSDKASDGCAAAPLRESKASWPFLLFALALPAALGTRLLRGRQKRP
jgi:hypothetical protein